MAGEKTEKATPKKLRDARNKGQVVKSQEVNTALMMLAMFTAIRFGGGFLMDRTGEIFHHFLSNFHTLEENITISDTLSMVTLSVLQSCIAVAPLMLTAFLTGIVANLLQVGFLFTAEPLKPKFEKINPINGFKRIFSMNAFTEMLKSIFKVTIIFVVCYIEIMKHFEAFPALMSLDFISVMTFAFEVVVTMAYKVCLALALLAVADYLYQRYSFHKNMRMTKEEIKMEYKQMEGDPKVKGRIRQKQQEASMNRMIHAVPDADVVITNPTHYAVALKYDEEVSEAPLVIAKGKDYLALKIKEIATQHNIEIVENKPLARSLYAMCEVNDQIPEDLFFAVAEILARIYREGHRRRTTRRI